MILHLFFFICSILLLWKGSDWIVSSGASLAKKLGLSELIIGLTIIAFGTSAPEFAVTISAALEGNGDISVGNIIGSNIFNIGFILGLTCLIRPISTSMRVIKRDGLFLLVSSLLVGLFLYSNTLEIYESMIMVLLLSFYIMILFFQKQSIEEHSIHNDGKTLTIILFLLLGFIFIFSGGELLISSSIYFAKLFGLSDWVISVTIIAAGTSAPELFASLTAIKHSKHGMAIGALLGSDIYNLLGVLGIAGIINPNIVIDNEAITSITYLIFTIVVVVIFMRTNFKISRNEGLILLLISIYRWYSLFIT